MNQLLFGLRLLYAVSFLFSAYTKYVSPGYFEISLMDQGLAPDRFWAAQLTRFIVGLEVLLGLYLLRSRYFKKATLFSLLLLFVFSLHLFFLWWPGDTTNCGCFGEMIALTPGNSLLKNLGLMGLATLIYFKSPAPEKTSYKIRDGVLSLIIMASMWWVMPLPQGAAFAFESFTHFEGAGRVDLRSGTKYVAVFNLDCEHCQAAAKTIGALQQAQGAAFPEFFVLFYKEGSTSVEAFETLTQTHFPYHFIEVEQFFNLIGDSPPRIYKIVDGKVVQFWDTDFETAFVLGEDQK